MDSLTLGLQNTEQVEASAFIPIMEQDSNANSKLDCAVKVWAGLGTFWLNAGAEVSQKENHSFCLFVCNYHPNACLLAGSPLPHGSEKGFCA